MNETADALDEALSEVSSAVTQVSAAGSQIASGRYQATGTTSCYWERMSGFSGNSGSTLANDIGSGTRIVDIAPTDVGIVSSRCGTWVRISA